MFDRLPPSHHAARFRRSALACDVRAIGGHAFTLTAIAAWDIPL